MHMEVTANFLFYLFNSGIKVAIYLAPVQPKGCPKAMAPPLGFTIFKKNINKFIFIYMIILL